MLTGAENVYAYQSSEMLRIAANVVTAYKTCIVASAVAVPTRSAGMLASAAKVLTGVHA